MEVSLMRHSKAIAARVANSTAFRLSTGKAPGSPRQTGHTCEFGGAPKRVEQEQKIFETVSNCTWTSSPITGSYFASKCSEMAAGVAISRNYSWPDQCWMAQVSGETGEDARRAVAPSLHRSYDRYGCFTSGALRYFSIGISKYISSFPFASWTPVR